MKINFTLDVGAFTPMKAHNSDAGFDLKTPSDVYVPARGSATVDTGVHIEIPEGYCGLLVSKSGLNVKHNLNTTGLIDCGYTGSIVAKVHNMSDVPYVFHNGDKITQLVLLPILNVELVEVESLDKTERGDNGFGSSGK